MKLPALSLALYAAMAPLSAQALSCIRPDIASTFQAAQASDATYSVLVGQLTFDTSALPPIVAAGAPPATPILIPARFTGGYLSGTDITSGYAAPVTLVVDCTGPWCGTITTNEDLMIFAQNTDGTLQIAVDACPMWVFRQPTQAQLDLLTACAAGGC